MDEINVDIETLIALVQERPVIWDRSLELYTPRMKPMAAWREISTLLNAEFETFSEKKKDKYAKCICKKWTNIRDRYMKLMKRYNAERNSGNNTMPFKKYIYGDQLSFLLKNSENDIAVKAESKNTSLSLKFPKVEGYFGQYEEYDINENTEDETMSEDQVHQYPCGGQKRKARYEWPGDTKRSIQEQFAFKEDRHVSFFKGVLPTIQTFSDTETIQFQSEVLHIIQSIQTTREVMNKHAGPAGHTRRTQSNNWQHTSSYSLPVAETDQDSNAHSPIPTPTSIHSVMLLPDSQASPTTHCLTSTARSSPPTELAGNGDASQSLILDCSRSGSTTSSGD